MDGRVVFVDLPGYGYAKVSKTERAEWKTLIEAYLTSREALKLSVVLLDARRGWMEMDLELKKWLEFRQQRFVVVATKVDKLKGQTETRRGFDAIRAHCAGIDLVPFSAVTGQGVRETWQTITKRTTP
jgi:GTP-binding protein